MANLEQINEMWRVDCVIDEGNIIREAARIPQLHNKYYMMYLQELLRTKKLKKDLKVLQRDKTEWLNGSMSKEDLDERGWQVNRLKIVRQDIDKYLESDKDVIELSLRIDYYEGLAKYLEDIVKQVHNRNFMLTNIINWAKFTSGGG